VATYSRRTFLMGAGSGLALVAGLSACGSGSSSGSTAAASTNGPMSMATLEKLAKKEGQLNFYGYADAGTYYLNAFKRSYPWAKINFFGAGSGTDLQNKILLEASAHIKGADVIQVTAPQRHLYVEKDAVQPTPNVPGAGGIPAAYRDPQGVYMPTLSAPIVMVYNTNTVKSPLPQDIYEYASPQWKGKIALDQPQSLAIGGEWLAAPRKRWGNAKWMAWLKGLEANKPMITQGATDSYNAVLRGDRLVAPDLVNDILTQSASTPMKANFYEGVPNFPNYLARSKNSPHPNMGELFLAWAISPAGSRSIASTKRVPLMGNIPTPSFEKGVFPTSNDWQLPPAETNDYFINPDPYLKIYNQLWPIT
jgi:ABC-type Fe3+ transport system substrate-binding protein